MSKVDDRNAQSRAGDLGSFERRECARGQKECACDGGNHMTPRSYVCHRDHKPLDSRVNGIRAEKTEWKTRDSVAILAMALSAPSRATATVCLALTPLLVYKLYKIYIAHAEATIKAKELRETLRAQLQQGCRFRLDNDTSATMILPDNRKLGYAEYGQPDGKPIIMLHGLPGSRLENAWHDEHAMKIGARIIGVDRPGVGWSSSHPGRTHLSFAQDIELLTNHLQLNEYAVIGTSGGGPYVMACAAHLPAKKLKVIANVCGMGDIQRFKSTGMGWPNWLG